MELGLGRGVAHADVKSVALELDGIDVAACERIVNVAATQSDSNSGAYTSAEPPLPLGGPP
eukprot:CAMPEP_0185620604 /NCGR_PEP_ID=MMETSP0436-20130131/54553_1 /TAXON_ID=626734 ORGANISM="Favella taraikaensis, Strain Fe Narragansett Bay" /NCGR_SAMPLE_ID=MMETSP0436 /ASSEMBLY_ACC=CAM_ASM_000390 /LENGTH=60 /DNA_ID=CAMNT_0028261123 /DNA_START=452 /DNA_END=631 /DNA_ORIENTATION=+